MRNRPNWAPFEPLPGPDGQPCWSLEMYWREMLRRIEGDPKFRQREQAIIATLYALNKLRMYRAEAFGREADRELASE